MVYDFIGIGLWKIQHKWELIDNRLLNGPMNQRNWTKYASLVLSFLQK